MAVQIVSNLHLEGPMGAYDVFEIVPRAPVLALLGDIGNVEPHKVELAAFQARQLRQFQAVLFDPGNHEAYHSTWPATLQILQSFEEEVRERRAAGDTEQTSLCSTAAPPACRAPVTPLPWAAACSHLFRPSGKWPPVSG